MEEANEDVARTKIEEIEESSNGEALAEEEELERLEDDE